ncbi:hypothetical protein NHX12_004108 [Muraenolepis orangiensis]|uniref:Hexosyltransferase n=1 Tax=Muraenolepis orangiensis TaxID=630683 RepID=A0A9Q0DUS4_9TELE|nr:hypothetical protein NHX12_004108 [Muraenolepis orangiensis]
MKQRIWQVLPVLLLICVAIGFVYQHLPSHFHLSVQYPATRRRDVSWHAHAGLHTEDPAGHRGSARGSRPFSTTCLRNMSMANMAGFSDLPERLQNFLYYQHCKHFPLLLDLPGKCGGPDRSSGVFLLLVIKSQPVNYERREALRQTWAKERQHHGAWIRTLFISGTTGAGLKKLRMNKLMEVEHRKHGDILQWDFDDTFLNLTLKQVLFMEWLDNSCPHVRFLLNGDDDVFAHTDNMVEYLQSLRGNDGSGNLYTGQLIEGRGPVRDPSSKYFVPLQVQQKESYPTHCCGGGFLLSGHTAQVLYNMSKTIALHPIDDLYMGLCLAQAGLKPSHHTGMRAAGHPLIPSAKVDILDPCYYKDLLMVHDFTPLQNYIMWNRIHDHGLKCWKDPRLSS